MSYPRAQKIQCLTDWHGTSVDDPFQWMESDHTSTLEWVRQQNLYTDQYFKDSQLDKIRQRLQSNLNYPKLGLPWLENGNCFYFKNDGLQNYSVLYVQNEGKSLPRAILDLNDFSDVDVSQSLSGLKLSQDGRFLCYGLSENGSDWSKWYIRDVYTGKDLNDCLYHVRYPSVSWAHDNKGFYYSGFASKKDEQDHSLGQRLYYHRIGASQHHDELIFEYDKDESIRIQGVVSEDGQYLLVFLSRGAEELHHVLFQDISKPNQPFYTLVDGFNAGFRFVGSSGAKFILQTDLNAPNGRVLEFDGSDPEKISSRELIKEFEEVLVRVSVIDNSFFGIYLKDAHSVVKKFTLEGEYVYDVDLPGIGTVTGFTGKRDEHKIFYSFSSFATPFHYYIYNAKSNESILFWAPKISLDTGKINTIQEFYTSKDGTKIPIFIVYRADLDFRKKPMPTYLYGYGGFGFSHRPVFSAAIATWIDMGGVYALANVRGGGEYGKNWHEAAIGSKKQTTIDDFISAAEYLNNSGVSSPAKLAIGGRSNGGLTVAATINQRPDLISAAIPAVGVFDLLRFPKFTIGWAWLKEYGNPQEPEDFNHLRKLSPLHNIDKNQNYPAIFVVTADRDNRVSPCHSYKYIATLQNHSFQRQSLLRVLSDTGHGSGKTTKTYIVEMSEQWAFLAKELGLDIQS